MNNKSAVIHGVDQRYRAETGEQRGPARPGKGREIPGEGFRAKTCDVGIER